MRKNTRAKNRKHVKYHRPSVVLGFIYDVLFVIHHMVIIIGWPIRAAAHALRKIFRRYPSLRFLHSHEVLSVVLGLSTLALAFALENLSHHYLWSATIETMRAAGVCPVWELIAAKFVRA